MFRLLNNLNVALLHRNDEAVLYPRNKQMCLRVLRILYEEGFVLGYYYDTYLNRLVVMPNFYKNRSVIKGITSFNKSTFPLYLKYTDLTAMAKIGVSLLILSTTRGFLPHYLALKYKLGGRAICLIK